MLHLDKTSFAYEKGKKLSYDFQFSRGAPIALMGESGAGKTTLLNLIAGFLAPKSGEILYEGASWRSVKTRDRPLSYLRQDAQVFGHLSVEKNLGLSRARHEDVKKMAEQLAIAELLGKKASDLSGGQTQRVLLAQVLLQKRPVVLLDEPFKGLDLESRRHSLEAIQENVDVEGQLLLISTHDERDVKALGARKILI